MKRKNKPERDKGMLLLVLMLVLVFEMGLVFPKGSGRPRIWPMGKEK